MKRAIAVATAIALASVATRASADCTGEPGTLTYGNPPREPLEPMSRPYCGGADIFGTVLEDYHDANGELRYSCLSLPSSLPPGGLPLLVYLHPSLFTPDTLYAATNIPEHINTANLSGDPDRPGFILLAPQGRNTGHFYPNPDHEGAGWDNWYRLDDNVDLRTIDHYIQEIVDGYPVDTDRIFVTGWSNGSAMAILYGHRRSTEAVWGAGGTKPWAVAAVGVYSSPNPYGDFNDPCPVDLSDPGLVIPNVPVMDIRNDCDIAGICQTGGAMMAAFAQKSLRVHDQIINTALQPAAECVDQCERNQFYDPSPGGSAGIGADVTLGSVNHGRWPHTWTAALFHFFEIHGR